MKRFVIFCLICAFVCMASTISAQTAEPDTGKYFVVTSTVYVLHGPDKATLQTQASFGRRFGDPSSGHISVLMGAWIPDKDAEDEDEVSFNPTLLWVDPITSWLDIIIELGGASKTADGDWGIIIGLAFNLRPTDNTAVHLGTKLMQGTPGKWDNLAVGGGVALYLDKLAKKIF